MISRRHALLGMATLAGCASPSLDSSPSPSPSPSTERRNPFPDLESEFGARLGVYAQDTGTGAVIEHRADERFAFCSTFKALAAAVLARNTRLDTVVRFSQRDLVAHAPITRDRVGDGMTIREVCDAAIRFSDGTAGNLLVRELGGPAELTAYARSLGDRVFRMDRVEPDLTTAVPGDPRDTTSPRAWGETFARLLAGDALPADKRDVLIDLLERNTTGDKRIRAGLPRDWTVADKTGSGSYATCNDIALARPPGAAPIVIALMSSKAQRRADRDERLLAEAAAYVAERF